MKLKEFVTIVHGATPSTQNTEYFNGKKIWIKTIDFKGKYIIDSRRKLTQAGVNAVNSKKIPKGTILLSVRKDAFKLAITGKECYIGSGVMALLVDEDVCLAEYLYYYLDKNLDRIIGAFKLCDLLNMEILLPKLEMQLKTVQILSKTDEVICINSELIKEFKKLMLDSFEIIYVSNVNRTQAKSITEMGIVVSDFYSHGGGRRIAKHVNDGEYAFMLTVSALNRPYKGFRMTSKETYDFFKNCHLKGGEIIISNIGTPGQVFRCPELEKPMMLGPNCIMIKKSKYDVFLYLYFKSSRGQEALKSITGGSAHPKFNKTHFRNLKLHFPGNTSLKKYENVFNEYSLKIETLENETKTYKSLKEKLYIKYL